MLALLEMGSALLDPPPTSECTRWYKSLVIDFLSSVLENVTLVVSFVFFRTVVAVSSDRDERVPIEILPIVDAEESSSGV